MPEKRPIRAFLIHYWIYIVVVSGLAILNMMRNPQDPWFFWVMGGWGIGVLAHGLLAYRKSRMGAAAH